MFPLKAKSLVGCDAGYNSNSLFIQTCCNHLYGGSNRWWFFFFNFFEISESSSSYGLCYGIEDYINCIKIAKSLKSCICYCIFLGAESMWSLTHAESPHSLWNLKVRCHAHKSPTHCSVLNQLNRVHNLTSYIF